MFFEKIKNLFSGRITDEEVESNEWLLCPKCSVNIMKDDLISNEWVCPNCNCHMEDSEQDK